MRLILVAILFALGFLGVLFEKQAAADVIKSSTTGFQVAHAVEVELAAEEAYETFIKDFSKWYDAEHSYTMKAENLSLDLGKSCMLEKLPNGGFVRHMEIVFHQPGKLIRMTGGLGPLQGMGVSGSLTFSFEAMDGKTKVTMAYFVSGADFLQLKQIATPVDQVLSAHLDRFKKHCGEQK